MWFTEEEEEEEEEEEKKEKKCTFRVYVKNSNLGVTALTDSFLHSSALFPVALYTHAHTSWLPSS
jgi:hypothetical protein